jgi:hypothetical protein
MKACVLICIKSAHNSIFIRRREWHILRAGLRRVTGDDEDEEAELTAALGPAMHNSCNPDTSLASKREDNIDCRSMETIGICGEPETGSMTLATLELTCLSALRCTKDRIGEVIEDES